MNHLEAKLIKDPLAKTRNTHFLSSPPCPLCTMTLHPSQTTHTTTSLPRFLCLTGRPRADGDTNERHLLCYVRFVMVSALGVTFIAYIIVIEVWMVITFVSLRYQDLEVNIPLETWFKSTSFFSSSTSSSSCCSCSSFRLSFRCYSILRHRYLG